MLPEKKQKFLTCKQAAELLATTPGGIRNMVLRKRIPFRKVAGRLLFINSELEALIENAPGLRLEDIR